jgi:hypothetical protein
LLLAEKWEWWNWLERSTIQFQSSWCSIDLSGLFAR